MTESIALPLWVVVAAGLFALWALYEHVVIPALRWMLTHPANRVIDDMSTRLRIGIRPFQRTRRQALIHRLLTDPKVQQAAEQFAAEKKIPINAAFKQIERYAREIVPAFNAYLYFRDRLLARPARRAAALPRAHRLRRWPWTRAHRPERDGGVRHEPPLEHGLRARRVPRRRPGGALLRGGRMGAHLAAVGADPRDGRVFRAAQFARRALPARARALHRHGDRGRRAAGGVPRRRAHARRPHARAQARRARLHAARLSHRRRPRPRLRAARPQL